VTAADRNEATVRDFLNRLHDLVFPDLDAAFVSFATNATYQSLVPARQPIVGTAAIKAELTQQFTRYKECDCEMIAVASNERYVFTERRDHVTMLAFDKRIYSSVNAVFEFNDAGQIISWREYWDALDIAQQLGLDSEGMKRLHGIT
jgi:limonene-1,2-epoxide hydrolase